MSVPCEFYVSSNGDRWEVTRDAGGYLQIVHRPNLASGGKVSITDVGMFLADSAGPQHDALLDLLRSGSLDAPPHLIDLDDEPS